MQGTRKLAEESLKEGTARRLALRCMVVEQEGGPLQSSWSSQVHWPHRQRGVRSRSRRPTFSLPPQADPRSDDGGGSRMIERGPSGNSQQHVAVLCKL